MFNSLKIENRLLSGFLFLILLFTPSFAFCEKDDWQFYYNQADEYLKNNKNEEAYKAINISVSESKNILINKNNKNYASALCKLGEVCLKLQKTDEAEQAYLSALKIYFSVYGGHDYSLFPIYRNLGNIYFLKSKFSLSENYFTKAIDVFNENNEKINKDNFDIWLEVGESFLGDGKYELAKNAYVKAVENYKKIDPENYLKLGFLYSELGRSEYFEKDLKKALEFYNQAVEYYDKKKGVDLTTKIVLFQNLECVYYENNNFVMAEKILTKQLELTRNAGDDYEWAIADYYLRLAQNKGKKGDFKNARKLCDKAMVEYENMKVKNPTFFDEKEFLQTCSDLYKKCDASSTVGPKIK